MMPDSVKKFLAGHRKNIIISVTLILFLFSLMNFYFLFVIAPQSNDECLWVVKKTADSSAIYFDLVKFEGVTYAAGIRDGDQLVAINKIPVKSTFQAQIILNRVNAGGNALYTINRNGEIINTNVRIKKLYNFQGIAFALLGFIWMLVGFVVIMAKPYGYIQILFYRIGALLTLVAFSNFFAVGYMQNKYLSSPSITMTIDLLWIFGAVFLPFVWLHFFWVFPKRRPIIEKKYTLKLLYRIPIVILSASVLYRVFLFNILGKSFLNLSGVNIFFLYLIFSILIFAAFVVGLVSLFLNYIKLNSKTERNQIFVILVSYFIGVAAIIYSSFIANVLADTIFNSPEYFMPILIVAIIPVAFAYSIFRYSLMDIGEVIKTALLYGAATIGVAAVYFLILYLLGQSISAIFGEEYQSIIAVFVFVIFAFIFQGTKDKFQNFISRKFYPEQFEFRKILNNFSNEINAVAGLENILRTSVEAFSNSLKIKNFGIALKNPDGNFILRASAGFINSKLALNISSAELGEYFGKKMEFSELPVMEKNSFEKVLNAEAEKLLNENIYTVIPLLIKSNIIGLVYFGLKRSGAQFTPRELERISAAVNQIASSIENARLYLAEAEKIKLDLEIENARKIQESLLPTAIPKVNKLKIAGKMIPAMQIGGDYFDFVKIGGDKLFAIIGDVSGKGLPASFYMSKLQTMFRLFSEESISPAEILSKINNKIYAELGKSWFITAGLILFDTGKMKAFYSRAGHPPILLIRNNAARELKSDGVGIGLEENEKFQKHLAESEIDIQSGDLFVIYSDGLTEAMNSKMELFGIERLIDFLIGNSHKSPEEILTRLIAEIDEFAGGENHSDDVTISIIKID